MLLAVFTALSLACRAQCAQPDIDIYCLTSEVRRQATRLGHFTPGLCGGGVSGVCYACGVLDDWCVGLCVIRILLNVFCFYNNVVWLIILSD